MLPQAFSQTTAAIAAMNLGVIPQPGQMEYAQQFSANGLGIFMYPNQMLSNQQAQYQQTQQQILFLQQQLAQQQTQQQPKFDFDSAEFARQMFLQQQRFKSQSFGVEDDGSKLFSELSKKTQGMSFESAQDQN